MENGLAYVSASGLANCAFKRGLSNVLNETVGKRPDRSYIRIYRESAVFTSLVTVWKS